jgi:hypothetical protein
MVNTEQHNIRFKIESTERILRKIMANEFAAICGLNEDITPTRVVAVFKT